MARWPAARGGVAGRRVPLEDPFELGAELDDAGRRLNVFHDAQHDLGVSSRSEVDEGAQHLRVGREETGAVAPHDRSDDRTGGGRERGHVANEAQMRRRVVVDEGVGLDPFDVEREPAHRAVETKEEDAHALGERGVGVISGRWRVQIGPPEAGLAADPSILAIKRKSDNNNYQT